MVEIKQLIIKSNVVQSGAGESSRYPLSPEERDKLLSQLVAECRTLVIELLHELKGR